MVTLKIIPLSQKPEFAPTCAAWSFGSWGCHIDNANLEDSVNGYKQRATNTNKIPLTWIGLLNDKIIGMISLKECSNEDRKDLSPWLSSVFIHPEFRKQGYASKLIQNLHSEAKKLGYKSLYLFTPDTEALYQKNGWNIIGKINDPRGFHKNEKLMEIAL